MDLRLILTILLNETWHFLTAGKGEYVTADEAKKELEQNMKMPFGCNVSKETSRMAIQAIETVQKLSERKMTIDALENYMQFEDECVEKGFTFKSVIEARDKQIANLINSFDFRDL